MVRVVVKHKFECIRCAQCTVSVKSVEQHVWEALGVWCRGQCGSNTDGL